MTAAREIVWTIAGSDPSAGAGIQADLKTFFDLGVHGCSAVTAITVQNSAGVQSSRAVGGSELDAQLRSLAEDAMPRAIKIGQLPDAESVETVRRFLDGYGGFVVCDPVLRSSSGFELNTAGAKSIKSLYPYCTLVTPNRPEAEALTGIGIDSDEDIVRAAQHIIDDGAQAVLIKGGHASGDWSTDFFMAGEHSAWMSHRRRPDVQVHGTGCALSSAIAAFVARGKALRDAIVLAEAYVQQGIRTAVPVAPGAYPFAQAGWPERLEDYPQVSDNPVGDVQPAFPSCDTESLGLYPVVDSLDWLERILPAGVTTIQLRIKDRPLAEMDRIVARAAALGRQYKARLFINDYWELAIEHGAYGVHLGQEDIGSANLEAIRQAGLRLGISTHSEYEWARAATFKPSYIALGTVFPTTTKPAILIGTENLCRWVPILQQAFPVTAIGGITPANIDTVLASGVGSVAVASAITAADDYLAALAQLNRHQ